MDCRCDFCSSSAGRIANLRAGDVIIGQWLVRDDDHVGFQSFISGDNLVAEANVFHDDVCRHASEEFGWTKPPRRHREVAV